MASSSTHHCPIRSGSIHSPSASAMLFIKSKMAQTITSREVSSPLLIVFPRFAMSWRRRHRKSQRAAPTRRRENPRMWMRRPFLQRRLSLSQGSKSCPTSAFSLPTSKTWRFPSRTVTVQACRRRPARMIYLEENQLCPF